AHTCLGDRALHVVGIVATGAVRMGGHPPPAEHRGVLVTLPAGDGLRRGVFVWAMASRALGVPFEQRRGGHDRLLLEMTRPTGGPRFLRLAVLMLMTGRAHRGSRLVLACVLGADVIVAV